jgi:phosphate transport system permease protein
LSRFRLVAVFVALVAGAFAAGGVGPVLQNVLFAGDIKLWLDGSRGTAVGGWMLLLFPVVAVLTGLVVGLRVRPALARVLSEASRIRIAVYDLLLVSAAMLLTLVAVWGLASLLSVLGFDPRGGVLDTYIQRNTFVVGFVMGFAIIPIIYTIAEDAFSSVPDHLRSASLAAGATQWQTVTRVVLPTAMSGVFSAVMIGLGRAVGETMIVLMAAGNTPILEWNIFSGFRTLSANLAVELPEAVRGDTHYRTLFLAALVLFIMTFAVNSIAEVVRRRYQRRSHQL